MIQLIGGEPLSPEHLTRGAPTAFLFGLHNAAGTVGHLMAQCMHPSPMNDKFMGMTEYVMESFHDLLMGYLELLSDSNSSRGSHHPSRECFMAGTLEVRVERVHEGGATLPNDLNDEVEEDAGALPRMRVEQLRARH